MPRPPWEGRKKAPHCWNDLNNIAYITVQGCTDFHK